MIFWCNLTRDERIWAKFHELLSLDLHDGNVKAAKERPAQNLHGSIASHKKVFERAVTIIDTEDNNARLRADDGTGSSAVQRT